MNNTAGDGEMTARESVDISLELTPPIEPVPVVDIDRGEGIDANVDLLPLAQQNQRPLLPVPPPHPIQIINRSKTHKIINTGFHDGLKLKEILLRTQCTQAILRKGTLSLCDDVEVEAVTDAIADEMTSYVMRGHPQYKGRVQQYDYAWWLDELVALFPGEESRKSIYFSLVIPDGKNCHSPQGILFNKLQYLRTSKNLRHKRKKSGDDTDEELDPTEELVPAPPPPPTDIQVMLNAIRTAKEVTDVTKRFWAQTHNWRCKNDTEITVAALIEKFPAIGSPNGYELLLIDFNIKFELLADNFTLNWESHATKIITLAKSKPLDEYKLLRKKQGITDPKLLGLLLLSYMFRTTNIRQKQIPAEPRKKPHMPSKLQAQESVIRCCQSAGDIEKSVQDYRDWCLKFGDTLQPFVLVVGSYLEPSAVYVCVDHIRYKISDILTAVDVCFKTFFALNAKYPKAGTNFWLYMQQEVYGIKQPSDPLCTEVVKLVHARNLLQ